MDQVFDIFKKWKKQELQVGDGKPRSKKRQLKQDSVDPEKAKIIRKLKYRTKYLDLEHEDLRGMRDIAKKEFFEEILKYCADNPDAINPLGPAPPQQKTSKEDHYYPDDLKTIYREIIMATHPDKHPNDEELNDICISATQAKHDNKIEDLINISFDLDIDISNISIELIEEIEKALDKKQNAISKIRQEMAVVWYHANNTQQEKLIQQICPIPKKED